MSIVQATSKDKTEVRTVEPLVIENATIDDDAVSDLVERHLKDFRSLQSTEASLLFGRPIVLKNCMISPEHLELLQTLPKLRMLRLEDCTISGGAKFSEKYAHIGKQKDSAPIMSPVMQHKEVPAEEFVESLDAMAMFSLSALLKPGVRCIRLAGLMLYVWEYLVKAGTIPDKLSEENIACANSVLLSIVEEYIFPKMGNLLPSTFVALTEDDLQNIRQIIHNRMGIDKTSELDRIQIEEPGLGAYPFTIRLLEIMVKRISDSDRAKILWTRIITRV